ncbi:hypothetical protein BH24ACT11_BH24ACT11_04960 [soil metagenome]|jgi:NhaP-type Na+/H+ or K+/H+ antiporter
MGSIDLTVLAVVLLGFALLSQRSRRWPVTMPMVMVTAGLLSHAVGLVDLDLSGSRIEMVGEGALALVLFSDAVRLDPGALRRERGMPLRLLAVGLPLSILLGAGIVAALLPALSLAQAALLAAVLAPTDPALGQAVVDDRSVPLKVRQSLNVESGLNDGLVLPVVLLLLSLAGAQSAAESWPIYFAQQVGLGVALGAGIGAAGGFLLRRALSAAWADGLFAQLGTLAIAVLALAAAQAAGGNGFVAAFVGGLAFAAFARGRADHLVEYTEDSGQLLAAASFFLFGNVLVPIGLHRPSPAVVVCAVATLTVGRLLPVAVSLIRSGTAWQTQAFVGWFGPRGLASIVFGLILLEEHVPRAQQLFSVIVLTVLLSVVAHGATAGWGARRYGAWYAASGRHEASAAESQPVREHRSRWRGNFSG